MSSVNKLVAIDFETYYAGDYSLRYMSSFTYVRDPRFDAYMVSIHDGESLHYVGHPSNFDWTLLDGMIPCAHNVSFDQRVLERLVEQGVILRLPEFSAEWVDTADLAAYLGCKRDLATASKYLLGRALSKVQRSKAEGKTGAELTEDADMLEYAAGDAVACYDLADKYLDQWPEGERRISELNRQTAMRGFTIDLDLVNEGIAILEPMLDAEERRIPWVWETDPVTGDILMNEDGAPVRTAETALGRNALKNYGKKVGLDVPTSTAKTNPVFIQWMADNKEQIPWIDAIGKYRSINTLLLRVKTLRDGVNPDNGRFPYEKKYWGATTGRFSGGSNSDSSESGGKFNMENMPRKAMYGVDVRPMFIARPGHKLIISDYNQIEPRYLLWRVGDYDALKPCFDGKNIYQAYAETHNVCTPEQDLKEMPGNIYSMIKARVILLGYQSGGPKFRSAAEVYNVFLSEEEAAEEVFNYRRENPRIVNYWYEHQAALAFSARRKDDTHQIELPSGRLMTYWKPRISGREISAYQALGEPLNHLYGGKLTENETQAACRDILCSAWLAIDKAPDMPPVQLTVHDEIVVEVKDSEADDIAVELRRLMTTSCEWAEGLPLSVDITITDRYTK